MDLISKKHRSWNMSQIRNRNTGPERLVRSALHKKGVRFRLGDYGLPGHPDVVLPMYKLAILVHGCFWHRHRNCKYAYSPKTRRSFWIKKFHANVKRDTIVVRLLRAAGWRSVVIWECETRDESRLLRRLGLALNAPRTIRRKATSRSQPRKAPIAKRKTR